MQKHQRHLDTGISEVGIFNLSRGIFRVFENGAVL